MNETLKTLIERKSTKSFKDCHIKENDLDLIISAGLNAPSGMNRQTPILIAVTDDETVKYLSHLNARVLGRDIDPFYGAREVIAVVARKDGLYVQDGSLVMGNLLNAAYSMGIGACWIHRAREVFESEEGKALLQKWGITDEVEGIGFCVLGVEDKEKNDPEIRTDRVVYVRGGENHE